MFANPAELIDAKGGNAVVAKDINYSEGAVGVWKHRGRIPRVAWPDLMLRYPDVTLQVLLSMERGGHGGVSVDGPAVLAPGSDPGAEKSLAVFSTGDAA